MGVRFNPFSGTFDFVNDSPDLSGYVPYTGAGADIDLGNTQKITNCQDPTSPQDVVTLSYLDTNFVPYTGATGNVDIYPWELKAGNLKGSTLSNNFGQPLIDLDNFASYDGTLVVNINLNSRQLIDSSGAVVSVDWGVRGLFDESSIKAMEWTTTQRQLFDFTGTYPSVDFGNYGLLNIGITNSGSLLDWSTGAGGSVKIYTGASRDLVGDFTNYQLFFENNLIIDWGIRVLYDNTNSPSVDWDYHLLSDINGTSIDWQSKYLYSDAIGIISLDYGVHLLNNTGGFTSIAYDAHKFYDIAGLGTIESGNYGIRQLYASDGTTIVLDWSTQQPSSGAQTAGGTYGATEQTMIQEMYDALRAYGLLS